MYDSNDFREKEENRNNVFLPLRPGIAREPLRIICTVLIIMLCTFLAYAVFPDLFSILGPVLIGILLGLCHALRSWAIKINYDYRSMPRPDKRDIWSGI